MDAAADVSLPPPFTPYQRMMTVLKAIPLGVGMTVENHYYDVHPDSLSVFMLEIKSRGIVFETLLNWHERLLHADFGDTADEQPP